MSAAYELANGQSAEQDLFDAQAMAEWFGDYLFGFSDEVKELPCITQQRLVALLGDHETKQGLDSLKDILLRANEDYQPGIALYICGYSDDAIDVLSEIPSAAIHQHMANATAKPDRPISIVEPIVVELFSASDATEEDETPVDLDKTVAKSAEKDAVGLYIEDVRNNGKDLLSAEQEVEVAKRIEAGLAAAAMLDGRMARAIEATDEELEWLASDGANARNEFLEKNIRLAVSVARKYHRRSTGSMQMADFISEANIGLIRAVEKFDFTKGYKFSTYAMWWLRQAITREIANQSRNIRIPVHMSENLNAMSRAKEELLKKNNREPTDKEIAEEMDISLERLEMLKDVARREPISLHKSLSEDGGELGDLIAGDDGRDLFIDIVQAHASSSSILKAIELLDPRKAELIKRRYGFYGIEESLDEIGIRFGVSRERIRQLQNEALRELMEIINYQSISEEEITLPDDLPATEENRYKGRKRSFVVDSYIERGKDVLLEEEMEALYALRDAGTYERAGHKLGMTIGAASTYIGKIRNKLDSLG